MQTFEEMCKIEPRLVTLRDSIPARIQRTNEFWREWSAIKQELCRLVGFSAARPEVASMDDYDTAYSKLLSEAESCFDGLRGGRP